MVVGEVCMPSRPYRPGVDVCFFIENGEAVHAPAMLANLPPPLPDAVLACPILPRWLKSHTNCPICRKELDEQDDQAASRPAPGPASCAAGVAGGVGVHPGMAPEDVLRQQVCTWRACHLLLMLCLLIATGNESTPNCAVDVPLTTWLFIFWY